MSEIEKKWYVLRAISGKEAKVKEYLEADIKNSDLGDYVSQVLIPPEKVYQVRNGKKIVKERSYLPGYVLVEAALVGEVAHHLRNTPNVIGFLGGSEKPVPLRHIITKVAVFDISFKIFLYLSFFTANSTQNVPFLFNLRHFSFFFNVDKQIPLNAGNRSPSQIPPVQ